MVKMFYRISSKKDTEEVVLRVEECSPAAEGWWDTINGPW